MSIVILVLAVIVISVAIALVSIAFSVIRETEAAQARLERALSREVTERNE